MEKYEYSPVPIVKDINDSDEKGIKFKYIFRQTLVSSGIWVSYFIFGVSFGALTVLVPQMRKENADAISPETASLLFSMNGYAAIPWTFVIPIISHRFGRRTAFRFITIVILIASIVFCCSTNVFQIFISVILLSVIAAGTVTVFVITVSEYSSPSYRGFFLTMKSSSFGWGVWISNAVGTFFHWRNIGIVLIVSSIYIFVTALFWPESPYWLANKKKKEECRRAYCWLNGTDKIDKELEQILNTVRESDRTNESLTLKQKVFNFYKSITCKKVYKPLLLVLILYNLYYGIGKTICMMYAIDMIKSICISESVAYTVMLILDGFTVFGMYTGCVLSKLLPRRVLLFSMSIVGVFFLLSISLYLYLIKFSVIVENKYVTTTLLVVYSVAVSLGPFVISTSIASELLPLKRRNTVAFAVGLFDRFLFGTYMLTTPLIFSSFGMPGAFLFFAGSSTTYLCILYKYLPETKDKTLSEIETLLVGHDDSGVRDENNKSP